MRSIFLILIVGVIALLIAFWSGWLSVFQTRPAQAPTISATGNGVTASGGQTPAFDVQTGTVSVGTRPQNVTVEVPAVKINRPANQAEPAPAPTNTQ